MRPASPAPPDVSEGPTVSHLRAPRSLCSSRLRSLLSQLDSHRWCTGSSPNKLVAYKPPSWNLPPESEEELKSLLKVKEESEKFGLKLNIQKTKIMASGPITSWEIDGETVETVSDFIFWAPKSLQMVTAAMKLKDAYSLEEKL